MRWDFVEPLVQAGAHVSLETEFDTTSLHMVAYDPKLLKVVLDADAEPVINLLDHFGHGMTPLMSAVYPYGGKLYIPGAKVANPWSHLWLQDGRFAGWSRRLHMCRVANVCWRPCSLLDCY